MNTNTKTKTRIIDDGIRHGVVNSVCLDEKLILNYASSLMRLLILTSHCGSDHPCTEKEVQILRRYDVLIRSRHTSLNAGMSHQMVMRVVAKKLASVAHIVSESLEMDPEFEEEVTAEFIKIVNNQYGE